MKKKKTLWVFLWKGIFLSFMDETSRLQHWRSTPASGMAMLIKNLYTEALHFLKSSYFGSMCFDLQRWKAIFVLWFLSRLHKMVSIHLVKFPGDTKNVHKCGSLQRITSLKVLFHALYRVCPWSAPRMPSALNTPSLDKYELYYIYVCVCTYIYVIKQDNSLNRKLWGV